MAKVQATVQGNAQATYRDHHATISQDGSRRWIFPKMPQGPYYNWRKIASYFLLVFLFIAPWIKYHGQQLLLLNILERKFVIFGIVFWPQDLHILVFAGLAVVLSVVAFTSIFGRIWCGWTCPQTIFMELLFRRIEYFIDGDFIQQMKLKEASYTFEKIWKRVVKHSIFYAISFAIGNTFLAYIIGSDQLLKIITSSPTEHLGGFTAMVVFSFVFYGVFAHMREQVCSFICPYGRMQSVLLDNNSLQVIYDFVRGEKRGTFRDRKQSDREKAAEAKAIKTIVEGN
jgi:cytochrome c oxidase accessory protein FixG